MNALKKRAMVCKLLMKMQKDREFATRLTLVDRSIKKVEDNETDLKSSNLS